MYKLTLIINNNVIEELDFDTENYQYLVPLDEDNINTNFSLKIKNLLPENSTVYPKTLLLKVGLSPSIFPSYDFSVRINTTVNNSSSITFSSDKYSFNSDSYVGIIFTEDIDLIVNFSNNTVLQNKFFLIPKTITPQEELVINFSLNYQEIESPENFSRNKFYRVDKILYDISKSFISVLENDFNISLSKFYQTYPLGNVAFLINPNSLQTSKWFIKDLLLFQLVSNGLIKEANGNLNSYLLNYEKNILSNCLITSTSPNIPFFSTEIVFNGFNLQTNTLLGTATTENYFNSLLYFVLYEITKPYIINSGYIATSSDNNITKISNLLYSLLSNSFANNSVKENINLANGLFYGARISEDKRNKYLVSIYLAASFFVEFVYKLNEKGYISSIPSSLSSLEIWLNNNIGLFVNVAKKINSYNYLDDNYELDFIISLFIASLFYSLSGKDIFRSLEKLIALITSSFPYFSNLSKFISEASYPIDSDNESLLDENADINSFFNKLFILGFWNSFSTSDLFKINLTSIFSQFELTQTNYQSISLDYLRNRAKITFNTNLVPTNINGEILTSGTNILLILPSPSINSHISNSTSLEVDLRTFEVKEDHQGNIILNPKLYTKTNYLNYLHSYVKLMASKIGNVYFFSKNSTNLKEAIGNLNTTAYLTYILIVALNNKEGQNNFNIKFNLSVL